MTLWRSHHGEILDLPADGLLCSANVQLNLSGGVGGAILLRHGNEMQNLLHEYLREKGGKHVQPGACIVTRPCGTHFRAVAHPVAIDGFYDTSAAIIEQTYKNAFALLAAKSCRTIAAACLGCGYGKFPASEFAQVISRLIRSDFSEIEQITFATTNAELADALNQVMPKSH